MKWYPSEPDLWGPGMEPTMVDGVLTIILIVILYLIIGYGLWENWKENRS